MIETWSSGESGHGMPEEMLVETVGLVRAHPWWSSRARLAPSLLRDNGLNPPSRIVDVGCGWGVNLDALERAGYQATGLDDSRQILTMIDRPERQLVQADLTQPMPNAHPVFDGALLLDVLEHLDDDRGCLRRIAPLVRSGGTLVVTVPALPELYSEYDTIQGHRRRYTRGALERAFESSGFTIRTLHWWGAWMVPILKLTRKKGASQEAPKKSYADYLRLPPWPIPLMMSAFHELENTRPVLKRLRTGTSLIAIATRD